MAEYRCFPIKDGILEVDFSNKNNILKSIFQKMEQDNIDNFLKVLLYLWFFKVEKSDEKLKLKLTKDQLFSLNNSTNLIVDVEFYDDGDLSIERVVCEDIFKNTNFCLDLFKNKDFDYIKKNNTHKISFVEKDRIFSHISERIENSLIYVYLKSLMNKS